ncbi:hypothetical protein [Capnocytophaga sp.]|uniref:hypothetical protein n=1 Tax=Capnocytophaga sp. TaxID=44737 RepID=UPI0026DB14A7|nr:hypothetical protein [Capnocytophaga sp.]MDO5104415.1 hypothetical protein [Capnocytophaga sp.]
MKKVFLWCFVLFSLTIKAQKGFYESIEVGFGSNFSKNTNVMTALDLDFIGGYEFSEKFRIGAVLPVSYMVFNDDLNIKHKGVSVGLGFNANVLLYSNEALSLRADVILSVCDLSPSAKSDPDWVFFRGKAGLQCYFNSLANGKVQPFISLGMSYYFDSHELPDNKFKDYQYIIPLIGIGIKSKFF